MALFNIGFSQKLHRTRPISNLRGSLPNILISLAESHAVGGEGGIPGGEGDESGVVGKLSHENGAAGDGAFVDFSLSVMMVQYTGSGMNAD